MEYNLAGIRNQILVDKLDDDEFEAGVVDNFINHTQRDIFNNFELTFMDRVFSGSIPTGATRFNIPGDVAKAQSRVITSPDGSQRDMSSGYMPFRQFNMRFPTPANNNASGVSYWTIHGNNIILSAPTDDDYTMTMFYTAKPTKLTQDMDVPEVPEEFSEALVLGAFMRVQRRNEDFDLARETEAEYQKILMQMVERYGAHMEGPTKMQNQQIR